MYAKPDNSLSYNSSDALISSDHSQEAFNSKKLEKLETPSASIMGNNLCTKRRT
ncbi:hypothetical protein [Candidatus Jidaibacter acanthamoebae]|uniref:hypothetical protein n=1 Tax=Candidatus Jidaibacter acanthamoebae TaxID=86105 RepID=UPI0013792952|nr:hypothetical protein [Candidatus Jidaibacter acanthamoeba]